MTSGEETEVGSPASPADLWCGFFEYFERQNQAALSYFEAISDPRMLRKRWLETMSAAIDSYMRSPAFLRGMAASLQNLSSQKAAQDEISAAWAHHLGIPLARDVHEVADTLRRTSATLQLHLKQIEERLSHIEKMIDVNK
jgi:hypothetical protein